MRRLKAKKRKIVLKNTNRRKLMLKRAHQRVLQRRRHFNTEEMFGKPESNN
ncbi:hypothetical protein [Alteromonas confluentis]|uniref:hypothetical protein n=1 Tax=Alteromonas confluentis TaxID=1656094 RepID=UPI001480F908|nr:hypothetical protein [Alteromonas confluentis]